MAQLNQLLAILARGFVAGAVARGVPQCHSVMND